MEFYSLSNPPPITGETNEGKSMVEEFGNISSKNLITNLIASGKSPMMPTYYDTDGTTSGDELDVDPTRSGSFDLADATAIQQQLSEAQEAAKVASTTATTSKDTSNVSSVDSGASTEVTDDTK